MPRTTLSALLLVLALVLAACAGDDADDAATDPLGAEPTDGTAGLADDPAPVDDEAVGEDTVVGGGEAADATPAPEVTDLGDDPETAPTPGELQVDLELTGDAEVPGPGSDGSGTATFSISQGQACLDGELQGIGEVIEGNLHQGGPDEAGPPILRLDLALDTDGPFGGCVEIDESLALTVIDDPADFYVSIRTEEFPEGAVRAQLA